MKMYMGYDANEGPGFHACLVFARTAKEAKPLAFGAFPWGNEYLDTRVKLIRKRDFLRQYANPELLESNTPHAIERVPVCERCERWGISELDGDGVCEWCREASG